MKTYNLLLVTLCFAMKSVGQVNDNGKATMNLPSCDFKVRIDKKITQDTLNVGAVMTNEMAGSESRELFSKKFKEKQIKKISSKPSDLQAIFADLCEMNGYYLSKLYVAPLENDPKRAYLYFEYKKRR
jgi:hypothetical protein